MFLHWNRQFFKDQILNLSETLKLIQISKLTVGLSQSPVKSLIQNNMMSLLCYVPQNIRGMRESNTKRQHDGSNKIKDYILK